MKLIQIVLALWLLMFFATGDAYAADPPVAFKVSPLSGDDKRVIDALLKKQASKWVPADELKEYPGLYWQTDLQEQSFKITSTQKGLEDTYFVPIQANYVEGLKAMKPWSSSLSLLLIDRKTSAIVTLPDHPVLDWNFYSIVSVAFRDVVGSQKRAILVIASGMTGIGPGGAEPFDVAAIYLPRADGSWQLDTALQKKLDQQCGATCSDINLMTKIAKSYFQKTKPR